MDMLEYIISNEKRNQRKKEEYERFIQRQKDYKERLKNERD